MPDLRRASSVAWALVACAVVLIAYWTTWYAGGHDLLASSPRPAYDEFEDAFPLADAWLGVCALLAAVGLWQRRPSALLWLLAGGGAGLYLACMDVLYDLEHDIWFGGGAGGLVELGINALTLVASLGTLRWTWRRRVLLLGGAATARDSVSRASRPRRT